MNPYIAESRSFFFQKLTEKELKLVEEKNSEHMSTYLFDLFNADVNVEEMKLSDSNDKYVRNECYRRAIYLTLESSQTSSEDDSETGSENHFIL